MLAVFGLKDREMQMGSGGVSRVSGLANEVPRFDALTDFQFGAAFEQVNVLTERAVGVLDEDVVGVPIIFAVVAADVGVVLDSHDDAAPRRMNGRSGGH